MMMLGRGSLTTLKKCSGISNRVRFYSSVSKSNPSLMMMGGEGNGKTNGGSTNAQGPVEHTTVSSPKKKPQSPHSDIKTIQRLLGWLDRREDSGYRGMFVSGHKHQDLEALVNNYTAPALARALRDREEILADCAALLVTEKGEVTRERLKQAQELLSPFATLPPVEHPKLQHPDQPANSKAQPIPFDESKFVLPDYRQGGLLHPDVLKRLSKRLNRLPREISTRARKRASVIVPLCHVSGEASVLFTIRSHDVNRHKGEVCFPGGMVDDTDPSIVDTALRELHEEVGIHPDVVKVLGVLRCDWSEVTSITGVAVTPIIGYLGAFEQLKLDPNPHEVREYFTVPVKSLLDQNNWELREFSPPVFRQSGAPNEHVIWGLTGYILHRFMRLLPSVVFGNQIVTRREMSF